RRHTRWPRDWSSDVCSSDLALIDDAVRTARERAVGFAENAIDLIAVVALLVPRDDAVATRGRGAIAVTAVAVDQVAVVALLAREIGRASCRERGEEACGGGA